MPKVLYVEDHPAQRDNLAQMLEQAGYEVATASDGIEGIEVARVWVPDLILMDLRMPRMDGFEAIKILREDPKFADIPILGFSAWASTSHKERALAAGANEHFTKPIDFDRLLTTMARYLKHLPIEDTLLFSQRRKSSLLRIFGTEKETTELNQQFFTSKNIPYIAGPPVINPDMFFGREQILQKIINILHNNNIMLTGPHRIGKTTLLYQLKSRLVTLDDPGYFLYQFLLMYKELQNLISFIR